MAYAIPIYLSAEKYSEKSGLGVEEVKKKCRNGEIKCEMTEGGHYKILVYNDAVPIEDYQKLKDEVTKLKTIISTIVTTAKQAEKELLICRLPLLIAN